MTAGNIRKEIDSIAARQARRFHVKNRHLDDAAIDAGLLLARQRASSDYKDHPAFARLMDELLTAVCAEVWRLREEERGSG